MVDLDSEETAPQTSTGNMFTKKKELLSTVIQRTCEWILSQEIPSDVTIHVGGTSFALHKFPLVKKCGYIRKLVSKSNNATNLSTIRIPDIPGGAEAFELAVKFCYGINFEISSENIALLRCSAEYLEMTEDYAVGNLVGLTEAYLNEVALKSIKGAVSILHFSEKLLPIAEKVKLVNRSIDTIAFIVCKDSQFSCKSGRIEGDINGLNFSTFSNPKPIVDWWAEDLTVLRIDFFRRVLVAMMSRGFKQYALGLGPTLMLYAHKCLRGLEISSNGRKNIEPSQEHEKRVGLETIVSLLPREKNALSVSFLSLLLKAAIYLETTVACRVDLEQRIALQLGQAILDDLLIPSHSLTTRDPLFDVETVLRIMKKFIEHEMVRNRLGFNDDEYASPSSGDMEKVGKFMENYLAKVAFDTNLSVSKFISIAEVIPEQSRITEDGIYKAIDTYLKAHPTLSEMERKKVCSYMNCQKLTRKACVHAAQNERLPVQTVMPVLYYEQQRLREAIDGSLVGVDSPAVPSKCKQFSTNIHPVTDEVSCLKQENQDLKFELAKMKTRLKEIEKSTDISVTSNTLGISTPSNDQPRLPRKSFINSVSRTHGKFCLSFGVDEVIPPLSKGQDKLRRDRRRYSIS